MLAVGILAAPAAHAQNLLTNGSFETGNFTGVNPQSAAADTTQLFAGDTNIDGWTVTDELAWQGAANIYTEVASDGNRFLDLTGYTDDQPQGGVTQSLSLIVGAQYQLTFDVGYNTTYSTPVVSVDISTDGTNFVTFTNSLGVTGTGTNRYQSFTYDFAATQATTPITLRGSTTTGGNAIMLDNVSLTQVGGVSAAAPEPGTFALLGFAALPFAGLVARRRKR